MKFKFTWLAGATSMVLLAAPVSAQYGVELSGIVGYTFSDGVSFPGVTAPDGKIYTSIEPADAMSWGFTAGVTSYSHYELAFNFDRQQTQLLAAGFGADLEVSDMNVDNYHGIFSYTYGRPDMVARPFLFGGMGATSYNGLTVAGHEIDGETQFSTTWGLGVKIFPADRAFGLRLVGRWTPTYIRSNAGGVWCDPYWGCSSYSDAEYSHAFELAGGVTLRFPIR